MINIEIEKSDEWVLYEKGQNYLSTQGIYDLTDRCIRFYHGDQWKGIKSGAIEPIVFNFIKPAVKYKTSNLSVNSYSVIYSPNNYEDIEYQKEMEKVCKMLNRYVSSLWQEERLDKKLREIIKSSCVTSEGILYINYNIKKKEVEFEVLNKTGVMYGNENDNEIENQPYILINFRKPVSIIRKEAFNSGVSKEDLELIIGDEDTLYQAGDKSKQEVDNMVTCLIKLYKKDGKVYCKKSTKYVVYEEDFNTGLDYYPLAHFVWEEETGSARGRGDVEGVISNQVELNKNANRRLASLMQTAFSKVIINRNIANKDMINKVGTVIEVSSPDDVRNAITYLNPAPMSQDASIIQNELLQITRDLLNASESVMGNIDVEKASGKAILAVQEASKQPLNEQLLNYQDFLEQVGKIIFNMWQVYTDEKGKTLLEEVLDEKGLVNHKTFTVKKSQLKKMKPSIKIDVTPNSAYDKFAREASMEQLLKGKFISFEEYAKFIPENAIMPKVVLQQILKQREDNQKLINETMNKANNLNSKLMNQIKEKMGGPHMNLGGSEGGNEAGNMNMKNTSENNTHLNEAPKTNPNQPIEEDIDAQKSIPK